MKHNPVLFLFVLVFLSCLIPMVADSFFGDYPSDEWTMRRKAEALVLGIIFWPGVAYLYRFAREERSRKFLEELSGKTSLYHKMNKAATQDLASAEQTLLEAGVYFYHEKKVFRLSRYFWYATGIRITARTLVTIGKLHLRRHCGISGDTRKTWTHFVTQQIFSLAKKEPERAFLIMNSLLHPEDEPEELELMLGKVLGG